MKAHDVRLSHDGLPSNMSSHRSTATAVATSAKKTAICGVVLRVMPGRQVSPTRPRACRANHQAERKRTKECGSAFRSSASAFHTETGRPSPNRSRPHPKLQYLSQPLSEATPAPCATGEGVCRIAPPTARHSHACFPRLLCSLAKVSQEVTLTICELPSVVNRIASIALPPRPVPACLAEVRRRRGRASVFAPGQ